MTFFIKLENDQPASYAIAEENFRQLFPQTSFPAYFTPEMVEPLGYGIYDFANQPQPQRYEKAVEAKPRRDSFGIWRQTWSIEPMHDEERAQVDQAEKAKVRAARNQTLTRCDWTQLPDAPLTAEQKAAWAAYRQQLRDISAQPGFPWDVQWPEMPA